MWLDDFVCALVDEAAVQSSTEAADLRRHLQAVLAIVSKIGGYHTAEDQSTLALARDAAKVT